MNFMMYQNKMPLRIYLVIGGGLVIGMSRVRIPLQANQERAYLVWKGSYINNFGYQHPFCFVYRLARKNSYVMALMPDRIKVGVRNWNYIVHVCLGRLFYSIIGISLKISLWFKAQQNKQIKLIVFKLFKMHKNFYKAKFQKRNIYMYVTSFWYGKTNKFKYWNIFNFFFQIL